MLHVQIAQLLHDLISMRNGISPLNNLRAAWTQLRDHVAQLLAADQIRSRYAPCPIARLLYRWISIWYTCFTARSCCRATPHAVANVQVSLRTYAAQHTPPRTRMLQYIVVVGIHGKTWVAFRKRAHTPSRHAPAYGTAWPRSCLFTNAAMPQCWTIV